MASNTSRAIELGGGCVGEVWEKRVVAWDAGCETGLVAGRVCADDSSADTTTKHDTKSPTLRRIAVAYGFGEGSVNSDPAQRDRRWRAQPIEASIHIHVNHS